MNAILIRAGFIYSNDAVYDGDFYVADGCYIHPDYPGESITHHRQSFHMPSEGSKFGDFVFALLFGNKLDKYHKIIKQLSSYDYEYEEFVSDEREFEVYYKAFCRSKHFTGETTVVITQNATVKKYGAFKEYDNVDDLLDNELVWAGDADDMQMRFINRLNKLGRRITRIEAENADLRYRPGGPGAIAAQEHFERLCGPN